MQAPRVSVVMASYNHGPFVAEAVNSVLTQSFGDIELVVTDDGSRDDTAQVIGGMRDSRIQFVAFAENRGACVALNDAIGRARGAYIAVLNSDDYFLPGKIERQVAFLDAHPEYGAVFGLPELVDERGRPIADRTHAFVDAFRAANGSRVEWLERLFVDGNCLCHPTVMLRKECYERVGRLDPLLMQLPDLDFWVRLCTAFTPRVEPQKVTAMRILDRERNTSAPSPERMARVGWETVTVLEHYARLPESELNELFPAADERTRTMRPKVRLALEALRITRPGYAQFGLRVLRECMQEDPASFSCLEYFKLVGRLDPCGTQYHGWEFRALRRSRFLRIARRVHRFLQTNG